MNDQAWLLYFRDKKTLEEIANELGGKPADYAELYNRHAELVFAKDDAAASVDVTDALACAVNRFREYASHHTEKGAHDKALRNAEMADMCEAAFSKSFHAGWYTYQGLQTMIARQKLLAQEAAEKGTKYAHMAAWMWDVFSQQLEAIQPGSGHMSCVPRVSALHILRDIELDEKPVARNFGSLDSWDKAVHSYEDRQTALKVIKNFEFRHNHVKGQNPD